MAAMSGQGGKKYEEVLINAADLKPEEMRQCPACDLKSVVIEAEYVRPFVEVLREGRSVGKEIDDKLSIRVRAIYCGPCLIKWNVLPPELFECNRENQILRKQVADFNKFRDTDMSGSKVM